MSRLPGVRCTTSRSKLVLQAVAQQPTKVRASDVMLQFYKAYNEGDMETLGSLVDEQCSYHDMIIEDPFVGRAAVVAFMKEVRDTIPKDLKFVVDDITDGDDSKVGIVWHLAFEDGQEFPFSRGCSFYRVSPQGQVTWGRDMVESALKPGPGAIKALALLAPLIRQLGPAANPANIKRLPLESALVWVFYAGYISYVMLSTSAPGAPAWATPPEVLQETLYESLNFFYVNIAMNSLGVSPVPSVACPPVSEALFNFTLAFALLFIPVLAADPRCRKISNKPVWYAAIMGLTNVFFIPFLALRAAPEPESEKGGNSASSALPSWLTRVLAVTGTGVAVVSLAWALAGRPEFGGLSERWEYAAQQAQGNRVFYAFLLDNALFGFFQILLLPHSAPPQHRYVPFLGLVAHLMSGGADGPGAGLGQSNADRPGSSTAK